MKRITVGVIAHVDSGKTTLSEAMLYLSGAIRNLGRVDNRDTSLDTTSIEKQRGITVFSKTASIVFDDTEITLIDTPGHVDFSAETERVFSVLDAAILVISASEGVQSHTQTLWHLLSRYCVPVFIFVNKMDLPNSGKDGLLGQMKKMLSDDCTDAQALSDYEETAMHSNDLMEKYLENGVLLDEDITNAIMQRKIFPCCFGAALKTQGVREFIDCLTKYTAEKTYPEEFGARVYKLSHADGGGLICHIKITGGVLNIKDKLQVFDEDGNEFEEKIERIAVYNGTKTAFANCAEAGQVCEVYGLSHVKSGDGLGFEKNALSPALCPVLSYTVKLDGIPDSAVVLSKMRILEEEDPSLRVSYDEHRGEVSVLLMGEIQLEVLKTLIKERFGVDAHFGEGSIVYRETIANTVEGIGHFEPLRHYAEVHVILEPGENGSGLVFEADCDEKDLSRKEQRLILSHLEEKVHRGVLTRSPITDMKITLVTGKTHRKHTEGGDLRQATYRAVRQGLMKADSILLEPWYDFVLRVPTANVGRAMTDIQKMGGEFKNPDLEGEFSIISGSCPVSEMRSYPLTLADYTHGKGVLQCSAGKYLPCHNTEFVMESRGYDPESDTYNSPDSVFCANGAGFIVKWDEVEDYMHVESVLKVGKDTLEERREMRERAERYCKSETTDKELLSIFEMTYGKIKPRDTGKVKYNPSVGKKRESSAAKPKQKPSPIPEGPEYLLVDGYNIIFAWDELKKAASESLDSARELLIHRLCNYQGFSGYEIILVFDAYKVKKNPGSVEKHRNISVVYTKEAETADTYIERVSHELSKKHRVRVATSDGPEQMIILGSGALRVPAAAFHKELQDAESAIHSFLS